MAANGSEIVWRPGSRRDQDVIGQDFLGRVMALALHAAGLVCLHGSAVGVKGGAIGFLGSKHAGKSTLAQALVEGGATLISDDMLAIDIQSTAFVRPGLPQVRLWSDSAARLGGPGVSRSIGAGGKHVLEPEDASLEFRAQPCAALYLLAPVRGGADAAARRTPVEPVAATAFLIGQNKLGRLLASAETARLFALYGKLARDVPVYRLEVSRGYDQLPEVVRQLKAWHEPVD